MGFEPTTSDVHYAVYNYAKPHRSLGGLTPAMALGLTDRAWEVEELW